MIQELQRLFGKCLVIKHALGGYPPTCIQKEENKCAKTAFISRNLKQWQKNKFIKEQRHGFQLNRYQQTNNWFAGTDSLCEEWRSQRITKRLKLRMQEMQPYPCHLLSSSSLGIESSGWILWNSLLIISVP